MPPNPYKGEGCAQWLALEPVERPFLRTLPQVLRKPWERTGIKRHLGKLPAREFPFLKGNREFKSRRWPLNFLFYRKAESFVSFFVTIKFHMSYKYRITERELHELFRIDQYIDKFWSGDDSAYNKAVDKYGKDRVSALHFARAKAEFGDADKATEMIRRTELWEHK
jgi:hypothetical protein